MEHYTSNMLQILKIKSRILWRCVKIEVVRDNLEDVIDKYCSAGAGATKELDVTASLNFNVGHIILLATKFKNLKKLRLNR